MTSSLTAEQRALGQRNAQVAMGSTRRDFLKAAAAIPAAGAFYFGYERMADKPPVRAAIIGTGDEGCQAMIRYHNRAYIDFIGFCDIRPSQVERAKKEFLDHKDPADGKTNDYSKADVDGLKIYPSYKEMIEDKDVEVVVIALPLFLHAPIAIEAMKAGKHVFCEKLMARNITQCKEMIRTARDTNRLLAIGHQRHYSVLYDNANALVQSGQLGDIRHIRALWHRNNAVPIVAKDSANNPIRSKDGGYEYMKDENGNTLYYDSWRRTIPAEDEKVDLVKTRVLENADFGYDSIDQLLRWRLYNKTGAGLMAELGSHQLDACSIFLGKKHPKAVSGVGGTFFYKDGREVDDHVFTTFEFPGNHPDDTVVVTYSSINTNKFENYGETLYGSRATLIVEEEKDIYLFKEPDRNFDKPANTAKATAVTVESKGGKPVIEASATWAGSASASEAQALGALATNNVSRGYREELEHFAFCVRNGDPSNYYADLGKEFKRGEVSLIPRCHGEVAMADAIIALTSNIAMKDRKRIEFQDSWFDYKSDDVPEQTAGRLAKNG
ncbi:MAG: Gfo/Idh/MocA family oxidoreductase [Isosphaeraceae bacterium]